MALCALAWWVVLLAASVATAADVTITEATTWSGPQTIDTLTVNASQTLTIDGDHEINVTHLVMGTSSRIVFNTNRAVLTVTGNATMGSSTQISGPQVTLRGGGAWVMQSSSSRILGNLDAQLGSLSICSNCYLSADAMGFGSSDGPGAGADSVNYGGSGGSHGGLGGFGRVNEVVADPYGLPRQASMKGSGGGIGRNNTAGGAGGGLIKLVVSGSLTHHGVIRSNGDNGAASGDYGGGGGAGGGVYVSAGTLSGNGYFEARGGNGGGRSNGYYQGGGGGSGGRVFVEYSAAGSFNPLLSRVSGGQGYNGGYAEPGTLGIYDSTNQDLWAVDGWTWHDEEAPHTLRNLSLSYSTNSVGSRPALIRDEGANTTVSVTGSTTTSGAVRLRDAFTLSTQSWSTSSSGSITMESAGNQFTVAGAFTLNNSSFFQGSSYQLNVGGAANLYDRANLRGDNLTLRGGNWVLRNSYAYIQGNLDADIAGMTVCSNCYLSADAMGFGSSDGPGAGADSVNYGGSGGSYGGLGGFGRVNDVVADPYGLPRQASMKGSGGGIGRNNTAGGSGGGLLKLVVSGTLTNHGIIRSNGDNGVASGDYGGGGGSGGSIKVATATLSGNGYFEARGGNGGGRSNGYYQGGGGGSGGRVFVSYTTLSSFNPRLSRVSGGQGYNGAYAEPGTMAFHESANNDLWVVDGWTLTTDEAPHNVRNLTISYSANSIGSRPALMRDPDGTELITASGNVAMDGNIIFQTGLDITGQSWTLSASTGVTLQSAGNVFTANGNLTMNASAYINGSDYRFNVTGAANLYDRANLRGENLTLRGGNWVLRNNYAYIQGNIDADVTGMTVCTNCYLSADGKGFGSSDGPGAGADSVNYGGSGGSYGGLGGFGRVNEVVANPYGLPRQAGMKGSGGGIGRTNTAGGAGGGLLKLVVSGTLANNGIIRSNGDNGVANGDYGGGGGSGGSVNVTTATLSGSGYFEARGGNGGGRSNGYYQGGGGGSGGRVFVEYTTLSSFNPRLSRVSGGYGYNAVYGDPGTLAFHERVNNDLWVVDGWTLTTDEAPHNVRNLTISYSANSIGSRPALMRDPDGTELITASGNVAMDGNIIFQTGLDITGQSWTLSASAGLTLQSAGNVFTANGNLTLNASSYINGSDYRFNVTGAANLYDRANLRGENLTLRGGNWVLRNSYAYIQGNLDADVTGMTVCTNCYLSADGKGFGSSDGPGAGIDSVNYGGSGGSYGGAAGFGYVNEVIGDTYGLPRQAGMKGSGGGIGRTNTAGGSGGGLLKLVVSGTLANNGIIRSNGDNGVANGDYGGGGGSGGSVNVTTATLSGSGYFEARGGNGGGRSNGYYRGGGGGSGGRVLVSYTTLSSFNPRLSRVSGGYGYNAVYGDPGTLAFHERVNNDLWVVDGWTLTEEEAPHNVRHLTISNSTNSIGNQAALMRDPDGAELITASGNVALDGNIIFQTGLDITGQSWTLSASTGVTLQSAGNVFTANGNLTMNASAYINGSDYRFNVTGAANLYDRSNLRGENLTLRGGNWVLRNNYAYIQGNIDADVTGMTVCTNCYLSADGKGFGSSDGPGAGIDSVNYGGSGGSYGGAAGFGYVNEVIGDTYGLPRQAGMKGSGGGIGRTNTAGGSGGGLLKLVVSGTLANNGIIRSNGDNGVANGDYGGGGGSGGSVNVTTATLSGSGYFEARGGNGGGRSNGYYRGGGGGSGGRVLVSYTTLSSFNPRLSRVSGGYGYNAIYGDPGTLGFYERANNDLWVVDGWTLTEEEAPHNVRHLTISYSTNSIGSRQALMRDPDGTELITASGNVALDGNIIFQTGLDITGQSWTLSASTGVTLQSAGNVFTANGNLTLNASAYINGSDYRFNVTGAANLYDRSNLRGENLTLRGGNWVLRNNYAYILGNLDADVTGMTVCSNCYLSADGKGFDSSDGPGAGIDSANYGGSGGSYGGAAGFGYVNEVIGDTYGLPRQAGMKGSGGGIGRTNTAGGAGGGLLKLAVSGTLANHGIIRSNGNNGVGNGDYGGGGGSGGSVNVTTATLSGNGYFEARGGNGGGRSNGYYRGGGGGSGGRVFVEYTTLSSFNPQLSRVSGGYGYNAVYGEPGTLGFYERVNNDLWVVDGWTWEEEEAPHSVRNLYLAQSSNAIGNQAALHRDGGGLATVTASQQATVYGTNQLRDSFVLSAGNVTLASGSRLEFQAAGMRVLAQNNFLMYGSTQITGSTFELRAGNQGSVQSSANINGDLVTLRGRDWVFSSSARINGNLDAQINDLTCTNCTFSADGRGFEGGMGPGAGTRHTNGGSGASHAGLGDGGRSGAAVALWYGSSFSPATKGSGGGGYTQDSQGGSGGGVIKMLLSGNLTLNGNITANGNNGSTRSGGGAGGSVYIEAQTLSGNGLVRANGGRGDTTYGGGGGGGRVLVSYTSLGSFNPRLSSVAGGYGYNGVYAQKGSLAFYDRDDKDLWIVDGWRWQQEGQAYSYRHVTLSQSTNSPGVGEMYDDDSDVVITATGMLRTYGSMHWRPNALTNAITCDGGLMSAGTLQIFERNLDLVSTGLFDMNQAQIQAPQLRLSGEGTWRLQNSGWIHADTLLLNHIGALDVRGTSGVNANVRGRAGDVTLVNSTSRLSATGKGFGSAEGPGAGSSHVNYGGSGASHGGLGGAGYTNTVVAALNDNPRRPILAGSGGGVGRSNTAGGEGGGAIDLVVSGTLTNHGYIEANGARGATSGNYGGGGGAGGTVYLDTDLLRGSGRINANGGNGGGNSNGTINGGGGGGGGRVFVRYNDGSGYNYSNTTITGGTGYVTGGLGTAAFYDKDDDALSTVQHWRWEQAWRPYGFADLSLLTGSQTVEGPDMDVSASRGCAVATNGVLDASGGDLLLQCGALTVATGARIDSQDRPLVLTATGDVTLSGSGLIRGRSVSLLGSGAVTLRDSSRVQGNIFMAAQSMSVFSGAALSSDGYGYPANSGPGAGSPEGDNSGSGASHGGRGGQGYLQATTQDPYGNQEAPEQAGSGGGDGICGTAGGAGAGAIRLNVQGSLTLAGTLYSDGGVGATSANNSTCAYRRRGGGGGSGGSIWLEGDAFSGAGPIYARGGNGGGTTEAGGGGAGGRIALCFNSSNHSGLEQISGGAGYNASGEDGSLYTNCLPTALQGSVLASRGANTAPSLSWAPGAVGIPAAQFKLRELTTGRAVRLRSLRATLTGSLDESTHISQVRLYLDANANGVIDQDEAALGMGAVNQDNGSVLFSGLSVDVPAGGAAHLLVGLDLTEEAPHDGTFQVSLASTEDVDVIDPQSGEPVWRLGTPVLGQLQRVDASPPPYVAVVSPSQAYNNTQTRLTLLGGYFTGATRVRLNDPAQTELSNLAVSHDGLMRATLPAGVASGRWDVRVTTPDGENETSQQTLQVVASCDTGLLGICGSGRDVGDGCEPLYQPGERAEVCSNGVDEDCDGADLDCRDVDGDGDGVTPAQGDCNDNDPNVTPMNGQGCTTSAGSWSPDDLSGTPRAVTSYSIHDDGTPVTWASDASTSWYQAAAQTLVHSALVVNGDTDYLEVEDSLFLRPRERLTVGTWVRLDAVPDAGLHSILARGDAYEIYYDAVHQCLVARVTTADGTYEVRGVVTLPTSAWWHVAVTYTGSRVVLWFNGQEVGTTSASGLLAYGDATLRIGGGIQNRVALRCHLDEVLVFHRSLGGTEIQNHISAARQHTTWTWPSGLEPQARFTFNKGPHESRLRCRGSFRGGARITGRSSQGAFPTFASVIGTSGGLDIIDSVSGVVWMRLWGTGRAPLGACGMPGADYTAVTQGRVYLAHPDGGIVVLDFPRDRVERWTSTGVELFNGGIGRANQSVGFTSQTSTLRLPSHRCLGLKGWSLDPGQGQDRVPMVSVATQDGVYVIRGDAQPYLAAAYLPGQDDSPAVQAIADNIGGCGIEPVGDQLYFGLSNRGDRDGDIVASRSYLVDGVDQDTPLADVATTLTPLGSSTCYGPSDAPGYGTAVSYSVALPSTSDVVVMPNLSRHPDADGDDHIVFVGTSQGCRVLDQSDASGDTAPVVTTLRGEDNGEDSESEIFLLNGDVDEVTALCARGNELFVGTNGGGVTRLELLEDGTWSRIEVWTTETAVRLPSNNVTSVDCGKNVLIATDLGVADINFPEPGPCDTGLEGVCGVGELHLRGSEVVCIQTVQPSGELCDMKDNDCDGTVDEHPELGSICDSEDPYVSTPAPLTVQASDCEGTSLSLPEPTVSDNTDPEPTLSSDAPEVFPVGRTTVVWLATDKDGNTGSASQVVTVDYDGQPELTPPADLSAEVVSPLGTVVDVGMAQATFCVEGDLTITHDAPTRFPLGTTVVNWRAQGPTGRPAVAQQRVTVFDDTPPTIEVGEDLTFDLSDDVVLPTPVVSDNGTAAGDIVVTHDAPQQWPARQWVTVTFTATDLAGNQATDTMRVYVRDWDLSDPSLTITSPTPLTWYQGSAELTLRVDDSICPDQPVVAVTGATVSLSYQQEQDGTWTIGGLLGGGAVYDLTVDVASACTGQTARSTLRVGVDNGAPLLLFNGPDQGQVQEQDPLTWPTVAEGSQLNLNVILRDLHSGLASASCTLLDREGEAEPIALASHTLESRSGSPAAGLTQTAVSMCTDSDHCDNNMLVLSSLPGARHELACQVTDVAGNSLQRRWLFRQVGLRSSIVDWREHIGRLTSDANQALTARDAAVEKLTRSLLGYDQMFFGNLFLGLEDAYAQMRQARAYDGDIDPVPPALLTAQLALPWTQARLDQLRGQNQSRSYDEAQRHIDLAQVLVNNNNPGDAFLELANAFFWMEDGRTNLRVEGCSFSQGLDVMDHVLGEMETYASHDPQMPGLGPVGDALEDLSQVRELMARVVANGDLSLSDLEHMELLMGLTNAAEDVRLAEEQTAWVRNWQWGLTQVVWCYADRAVRNAGTWLGPDHPVLGVGRQALEDATTYRDAFAADDFMVHLIETRCTVVGVYNLTYDPDFEVPPACCDHLRELQSLDPEVPLPDHCPAP